MTNFFCNIQEAALAKEIKVLRGSFEVKWDLLDNMEYGYRLAWLRDDQLQNGLKATPEHMIRCRFMFEMRNNLAPASSLYLSDDDDSRRRRELAAMALSFLSAMAGKVACFDARDRVFDTFGFFNEEFAPELAHKNTIMGLDEFYSIFFQYLLVESTSSCNPEAAEECISGWWGALYLATAPGKRTSLPSWCPDFHQRDLDQI